MEALYAAAVLRGFIMRVKIIVNVILQGCGDVEAAGEESTLSLLHAYLRLVQVTHGE